MGRIFVIGASLGGIDALHQHESALIEQIAVNADRK
jgi:hypothetical protein